MIEKTIDSIEKEVEVNAYFNCERKGSKNSPSHSEWEDERGDLDQIGRPFGNLLSGHRDEIGQLTLQLGRQLRAHKRTERRYQ